MHMLSASLVVTEAVQILVPGVLPCNRRTVRPELVLAETKVKITDEKVSADGCRRKCRPEPVMGGQDPWILCNSR